MTALVLGGTLSAFVLVVVAVAALMDRESGPAAPSERPGTDDQWSELVPVMRSVRRHRRHIRRAVRGA